MLLTEDRQVRQFSGKGQLRLGADIQLAVGPVNYVHIHFAHCLSLDSINK